MDNDNKITKDIIILYHAECNDGFGAAWAAWKKFGYSADYIPIEHQVPLPEGLNGKQVFFIDIIPDEELAEKVIRENSSVVAIDHHKTNEPVMSLFKEHSFDNNHSGAVLAWKYFHPDKPAPKLLLLIEDVDIGKWEYPETNEFIAALGLYDFDFKIWDKIASDAEDRGKISEYLAKGKIVNIYINKIIESLVESASIIEFEGGKIYSVNAPDFINGLVATKLASKFPPFAITWYQDKDMIYVSLRSDGAVDVSEIAKKYGGGGHKAAAGFSFPVGQPFPWKKVKEGK